MVTSPGWMIYPRDNGFFDSWLLDPSYLGSLSLAQDQAADTVRMIAVKEMKVPTRVKNRVMKAGRTLPLFPARYSPTVSWWGSYWPYNLVPECGAR